MKTVPIIGFENYTISEDGTVTNNKTGKKLNPFINHNGYLIVGLSRGNNSVQQKFIHRLLMEEFVPNHNNYKCVNHLDGNKLNNNLSNLEWCSHSYNNKHAYKTGLKTVSENVKKSARQVGLKNKGKGKLILNIETGIYYTGINEALESLHYKIHHSTMWGKMSGHIKNNTPFRYAQ